MIDFDERLHLLIQMVAFCRSSWTKFLPYQRIKLVDVLIALSAIASKSGGKLYQGINGSSASVTNAATINVKRNTDYIIASLCGLLRIEYNTLTGNTTRRECSCWNKAKEGDRNSVEIDFEGFTLALVRRRKKKAQIDATGMSVGHNSTDVDCAFFYDDNPCVTHLAAE